MKLYIFFVIVILALLFTLGFMEFSCSTKAHALSGYDYVIPFQCDSSKIDGDLTDFPVRLILGEVVGLFGDDLTPVFDELGDNYFKLAITTAGDTQCPVEVAYWDSSSETAELYFKAPFMDADIDTTFYLYYDGSVSDNVSYVGTPSSSVANSVWSNGYDMVYHVTEVASGTDIPIFVDSARSGTVNWGYLPGFKRNRSGFPSLALSGTVTQVEGWGSGYAAYIPGTNCAIVFPFTGGSITHVGTYTHEMVVYHSGTWTPTVQVAFFGNFAYWQDIIPAGDFSYSGFMMDNRIDLTRGDISFDHGNALAHAPWEDYECWDDVGSPTACEGFPVDEWVTFSGVRYGSLGEVPESMRLFQNGELVVDGTYNYEYPPVPELVKLRWGWIAGMENFIFDHPTQDMRISIDEYRYTSYARSDAWMEASQTSFMDELVSWFIKPEAETLSLVTGPGVNTSLAGRVTELGNLSVEEYGFVYGYMPNPLLSISNKSSITEEVSSAPFDFAWDVYLPGTYPAKPAYFRAFASDAYTTGYGTVMSSYIYPTLDVGTDMLWLDFEPEESSSGEVEDLSDMSNNLLYSWLDPWTFCASGSGAVEEDPVEDNVTFEKSPGVPSRVEVFGPVEPPDSMYQEGEGEGLPLYELFGWTSQYLGWGTGMLYMFAMMIAAVGLGLGTSAATSSPVFGGLVCGFVLAAGVSTGVVPLWLIIVYGFLSVSFLVSARAM